MQYLSVFASLVWAVIKKGQQIIPTQNTIYSDLMLQATGLKVHIDII